MRLIGATMCLFACANLCAMQGSGKLTILDLHQMDKQKFTQLNDDQKWDLVEGARGLLQDYAHIAAKQHKALVDKDAAFEELGRITNAMTVATVLLICAQSQNANNKPKN